MPLFFYDAFVLFGWITCFLSFVTCVTVSSVSFLEGWSSCSYITFVRTILFKMKTVEAIKAILKDFDLDGDGFLTPDEVSASMMENDYEPDSDDLDFLEMIGTFADEDGRVKIKKVTGKYSKTKHIKKY